MNVKKINEELKEYKIGLYGQDAKFHFDVKDRNKHFLCELYFVEAGLSNEEYIEQAKQIEKKVINF